MTAQTQRLEVAFVVISTAPTRHDVIDHFGSDNSSFAYVDAQPVNAQRITLQ